MLNLRIGYRGVRSKECTEPDQSKENEVNLNGEKIECKAKEENKVINVRVSISDDDKLTVARPRGHICPAYSAF